jgi:ribosomal protein S18 acetylase RimI-like enzyme
VVSFREASVDDVDAHALIAEYFTMRAETFPSGDYSPVFPATANFTPPAGLFLIVVEDGEDIGCGGIKRLTSPVADTSPVTEPTPSTELVEVRYEIKHLWIRPRMQGRGLGRALLTELEQRARAFGATEVVLDTNASLVAAGSMYRSGSYEEIASYNENPNATNWFRKTLVD